MEISAYEAVVLPNEQRKDPYFAPNQTIAVPSSELPVLSGPLQVFKIGRSFTLAATQEPFSDGDAGNWIWNLLPQLCGSLGRRGWRDKATCMHESRLSSPPPPPCRQHHSCASFESSPCLHDLSLSVLYAEAACLRTNILSVTFPSFPPFPFIESYPKEV